MFFVNNDQYAEALDEKVVRKVLAHDADLMIVHMFFKQGGIAKRHSHIQSQATYVIKGKFEYDVDGDTRVLLPGDSVYVPSGAEHAMVCLEEGEVLDSFAPERKDLLF